jgi:NADH-ubiquinone oxidoreductase chain 2
MLIYSIIILLLATAVNNSRDTSILFSRLTVLALISTILVLSMNINFAFIQEGLILYGGLFILKSHIFIFILFVLILSVFIVSINSFFHRKLSSSEWNIDNFYLKKLRENSIRKLNIMTYEYRIIEYPLIILFCLTGAVFLMCSYDVVSIFLAIELQSYGLYLLCSIHRNSESSIHAGLTYFLLGGLSSCIILLGISLLYINTGNTSLENIYMINSISNAFANHVLYDNITLHDLLSDISVQYTYIQLPLAIMSVGFLFKIGSAPFHFWSPDVYDAIPTNVTTFVAIIAKISILILLFEFTFYTDSHVKTFSWLNNIIFSSLLSLLIGSILGLVQYRIKRLYAYSTISHLGFLLLALGVNSLESSRALFFYLIQYSLSNLNAFIILITIGYNFYFYVLDKDVKIKSDNYSPVQMLSQLKGYYFLNPMIAISLTLTLFSFVGVPPLVGFFGKQMVLISALDNGYFFMTLIGIITSVISAVYYLVLVKIIFFEKSIYKLRINKNKNQIAFNSSNVEMSSYLSFSISFLTLFIMFFMFFDQEFIRLIYLIT